MIEKPAGWFDIWENEPPRYEDIEFMTGNGIIHLGQVEGWEKLRKCDFYDYDQETHYECSVNVIQEKRVLYWKPI